MLEALFNRRRMKSNTVPLKSRKLRRAPKPVIPMPSARDLQGVVVLSPRDVARRADVTTMAVLQWERKGVLPCLKTESGRRIFLEHDVKEFLETRRRTA